VRLAQTDDLCLRLMFASPYGLTVFARTGLLASLLRNPEVVGRLRGGALWPGSTATRWVDENYGADLCGPYAGGECLTMLALLAPQLIAEDRGIRVTDDAGAADLDTLDVACEHGIPVAGPVHAVALTAWYRRSSSGRRALEYVVADPRYRELLRRAVATFESAPEPVNSRGPQPPFERGDLLQIPALAPIVAEVFPHLAD
jgi:hypothetical protein